MSEFIIFVGLQGAGKSTWYREHFAMTHALVSKDLLPKQQKQLRQMQLLTEYLAAGQSVVVDNTNPTIADRAPLIAIGHTYGATLIAYYFDVPFALCLQRNRQRSGLARVPDIALYALNKRFTAPTSAEGFDQVLRVTLDADGTAVSQLVDFSV